MPEIIDNTVNDVALPDYPKTPEYSCLDTLEYCKKLYELFLLEYGKENIVFLGDSAGGGLAISLFMYLRDIGIPTPKKLILMSPWLDVSMSNKEVFDYREKDLILTIDGLIECGKYYAGETDTKDWRTSPMYGNLENLPETHIFVGGSELFYPDCRDFVSKAKKEGYMAELHFYDNMQHDWPIIPMIPEAKQARNEIIGLIKE